MKIRKGAVGTAVAAAILTATACQEDIVVPEPDPHVATVASLRSAGRLDYDGHMAQMAADLPGFAGYYSDGEEFVVRMKGAEHSDEVVRGAVSDFIERRTSRRARPAAIAQRVSRVDRMVVRPATYDFLELYTWQRRILSMDWPVGTLSYLDIDEVENTIQVGVAEPTAVRTIHQAIRELGVPPAAFDVRARPRGRLHLGLQNQITNEVGGIQIEVWNGLGFCSLGFNLDYSGDSEEYFVTAAHCTSDDASIGEVEGNYAHQPTTSHGTIGDEDMSPRSWTSG